VLVPAYFHPTLAPAAWTTLTHTDGPVGWGGGAVVLNVASGPGGRVEAEFVTVVGELVTAGVRVLGYVDVAYGRRAAAEVLGDVGRYREWYGTEGVFLDRAPSDAGRLAGFRGVTAAVGGAVVANHGVYPEPGYAECADLLVVFEGPLAAHRDVRVPEWARRLPASRFCHLVYDVPAAALPEVRERAAACNAGVLYATDRGGANPYDGLPSYFAEPPGGRGRLAM
jgi:hypothetical protein